MAVRVGWQSLTAFDYSADAVVRARAIFGERNLELLCADARDLPFANESYDAVLDKGALDAIGLAGKDDLHAAAAELSRVMRCVQ
jgi:ubiquinone/menaquinone biosynthesis C-methylase UbiE